MAPKSQIIVLSEPRIQMFSETHGYRESSICTNTAELEYEGYNKWSEYRVPGYS